MFNQSVSTLRRRYKITIEPTQNGNRRRWAKGEISTFEVLMKINGYKWGDKELEQISELDLFEVHNRLLRLIKKEKKYVADFSAYDDQCVGLPFDIPFVFRKFR